MSVTGDAVPNPPRPASQPFCVTPIPADREQELSVLSHRKGRAHTSVPGTLAFAVPETTPGAVQDRPTVAAGLGVAVNVLGVPIVGQPGSGSPPRVVESDQSVTPSMLVDEEFAVAVRLDVLTLAAA